MGYQLTNTTREQARIKLNNYNRLRGENNMVKFEEKFVVINRKHIENISDEKTKKAVLTALDNLFFYLEWANVPDNKYFSCNQDEPYAQKVLDMILEGETKKEEKDTNE